MINDITIRERPDEKFYDAIKELRTIGINLNQIAHKCNALGIVDPIYQEEARKWNEFIIDIKKKFLL